MTTTKIAAKVEEWRERIEATEDAYKRKDLCCTDPIDLARHLRDACDLLEAQAKQIEELRAALRERLRCGDCQDNFSGTGCEYGREDAACEKPVIKPDLAAMLGEANSRRCPSCGFNTLHAEGEIVLPTLADYLRRAEEEQA